MCGRFTKCGTIQPNKPYGRCNYAMSDILQQYLKSKNQSGDILPTLIELHRALEQPAEADQATLDYLAARPELARLVRNFGKEPDPERLGEAES
jgi:hypothetical protein